MNAVIDLNSDLGEGAGFDEEILRLVTSANIACGFHAGDPQSILATIRLARKHGVAIGAHPSFEDRANFGRTEIKTRPAEVFALVTYQVGALQALARAAGAEIHHVKPHGALYNIASRDKALADAIAHAVLAIDRKLIVFGQSGGELLFSSEEVDLRTVSEVFADRNYMTDGSLVPRSRPDALLHDPIEAADRVIRMVRERKVRAVDGTDITVCAGTVCVHGDTPGAVAFASALRAALLGHGVKISPPQSRE